MSENNLLDLREKPEPEIQIVEKIIIQKRSWAGEIFRVCFVIAIVSVIVYGVSHADSTSTATTTPDFIANLFTPSPSTITDVVDDIGIYGTVVSIEGSTLSLDDSQGSQYNDINLFNVDLSRVTEVVLSDDNSVKIPLSDIKAGDNITVQGSLTGNNLDGKRIIYFSPIDSSSTATSTDETATSTPTTTTETIDASSTSTTSDQTVDTSSTSTEESTSSESIDTSTSTSTDTEPVIPTADSTSTATTSVTSIISDLLSNLISPPPADSTSDSSPDTSASSTP